MKQQPRPQKSNLTKKIIIATLVSAGLLAAVLAWGQPFLDIFSNQEAAKRYVEGAGIFGPVVFMLMQIVQVVVAPLPGQVAGLLGGYLFGPFLGLLYSIIGATIGFTIIFVLARKLGRPFVERFFSKELIDKFDYITKSKGTLALFLIFLLPAFPDDLICYLAGLTTIPIRKLIIISLAGRIPGYLILSLTGNGLGHENMNPIIITLVAALMVFGIAFWKRSWLNDLVRSGNYIEYVKQHWGLSRIATTAWITCITILSILLYYAATVTPIQQ